MSFSPSVYVAAAVGYAVLQTSEADSSYFSYPQTEREFAAWFGRKYPGNITDEEAETAIAVLDEAGLITFDHDPFAGRFVRVDEHSFRQRWYELVEAAPESPFGKASEFGDGWLRAVFDNASFWTELHSEPTGVANFLLPESVLRRPEPVVFITEGSAEGAELKSGLERIAEELRTNNEIANELGDERPRIMAEVNASSALIKPGAVRISAVREVLVKVLREIARKLKDKAIDLGVDRLLEIALRLIGG